MSSRATLLRRRADLLEEQARIDRELADLEAKAAPADLFSSDDLPPGTSRRTFRETAALIVGAYRSGATWFVARDAWFAHRAKPARKSVALAVVTRTAESDADAAIARAGLRPTRRSA